MFRKQLLSQNSKETSRDFHNRGPRDCFFDFDDPTKSCLDDFENHLRAHLHQTT